MNDPCRCTYCGARMNDAAWKRVEEVARAIAYAKAHPELWRELLAEMPWLSDLDVAAQSLLSKRPP
jgi:hypothetical protein